MEAWGDMLLAPIQRRIASEKLGPTPRQRESTLTAYNPAVQRRGAIACNFRAKSLAFPVEHQTVTTPGPVDCIRQIVHSSTIEPVSQVSNCAAHRVR